MTKRKHAEPVIETEPISPAGPVTPTRPKRTKSPRKKATEEAWDPYASTGANRGSSPLTDLEAEDELSPSKRKGGKRKKKTDELIVYDIPPVERKVTKFKGRLGYACLNTILRVTKPEPTFCSRTCRKDTIHKNGIEFAKDLGLKNTRDLLKLIQWNEDNKIRFMRISSEMFPFASHGELGYDLEYAKDDLKAVGDLAKKLGHRLTTHPGQFTQLASPREAVVDASVRELEYHCQMMRYMGLGKDSVIILHMGGVYNDKPSTIARFRENFLTKLTPEMRDRLVLENDEMCYSVDDLLPICEELQVPIVLDYHHNWINPSEIPLATLIPRINRTWHAKGIKPKQHLSSPKPQFEDGSGNIMDRRAHADRCHTLPEELNAFDGSTKELDVDLMIEAKDKEQAVFFLYRIYGLEEVIWENLRPAKKQVIEKADQADLESDDGPASPRKKRRTRAKQEAVSSGDDADAPESRSQQDTLSTAAESPKKRSREKTTRRGATDAPAAPLTAPTPPSESSPSRNQSRKKDTKKDGATPKSKRKTKNADAADLPGPSTTGAFDQSAERPIDTDTAMTLGVLGNQEEAPVPVDGADVGEVEAEEHPEAMEAAMGDGDGCGVGVESTRKEQARLGRGRGRKRQGAS